MGLIIGILAYIALTGLAIYFGKDEGVFDTDSDIDFAIRMLFLLTIGWLIALLIAIGAGLVWVGATMCEQFLMFRMKPYEGDFSILHWIGRNIKHIVMRIIPKRKKKDKVEACQNQTSQNDSQTEQKES